MRAWSFVQPKPSSQMGSVISSASAGQHSCPSTPHSSQKYVSADALRARVYLEVCQHRACKLVLTIAVSINTSCMDTASQLRLCDRKLSTAYVVDPAGTVQSRRGRTVVARQARAALRLHVASVAARLRKAAAVALPALWRAARVGHLGHAAVEALGVQVADRVQRLKLCNTRMHGDSVTTEQTAYTNLPALELVTPRSRW